MPLDTSLIKPYGEVTKLLPPTGSAKLATVEPTKLNALMKQEALKKTADKSKIVFVDCQSEESNLGKQAAGAIHMDFEHMGQAAAQFETIVKSIPSVYNKLGAADLVVFYCMQGQSRSPMAMQLYKLAVGKTTSQPATYNKNQDVVLLAGGIQTYATQPGVPNVTNYVLPGQGKVVAEPSKPTVTKPVVKKPTGPFGPKFGNTPKPTVEDSEDPNEWNWGRIYTDP